MDIKVWKNGFLVDASAELACDTLIITPVGEPSYSHAEWEVMLKALRKKRCQMGALEGKTKKEAEEKEPLS